MLAFEIGDRVLIKSRYAGIYNGKTGVVVNSRKDSPLPDTTRVRFDVPILIGKTLFEEEAFFTDELRKTESHQ